MRQEVVGPTGPGFTVRSSLPLAAFVSCSVVVALSGCGDDGSRNAGPRVERDTIGDTIVVRTLSGSAWGEPASLAIDLRIGTFDGPDEYTFGQIRSIAVADDGAIYVFDSQVPALRKYGADGTYIDTFGREGGGPGEYRNPDGGLAVLPEGRVLLRDPGNSRINVYAEDGEPLDSWRIRGGYSTSRRLYVDTSGHAYTVVRLDPEADLTEWNYGLVRLSPQGEPTDTLVAPTYEEPEPLVARMEEEGSRSTASRPTPFATFGLWSFSPHGYFVGGIATSYAIDLYRDDGVLRIGREYEPVPVLEGERADHERRTVAAMRRIDPAWQWNGPAIPEVKPPYRMFFIGQDGRIWVELYQRATERAEAETAEEPRPGGVPELDWEEPVALDVFEPDGRYLGLVRAPEGLSIWPTPVARGDTVWAVIRDELDVPYLVRLHVERGPAPLP